MAHIARFTWRDWRAGELNLLIAALVIAVAAVASVGFFVDRMRLALEREAADLLGADLVIVGDRPLPARLGAQARLDGLRVATTAVFPSMTRAQGRPQLASVKAVSAEYPLRGAVRLRTGASGDAAAGRPPASGEAWADPQLLVSLGIGVGDTVGVGRLKLRVTGAIALEPDRGAGFVNLAPRLLISAADLDASGLVQPGSRVTYRLLIAGGAPDVADFRRWVTPRLDRGQRLEALDTGRPELRRTLERAQQFLSLVALLSALIAAVAVALAARRFADRHLDACAVIKAIGVEQRALVGILLGELLLVAMSGGVIGALSGWGVHHLLVAIARPLVAIELPPATWAPAWQAMIAALVLLMGFGAWPFVRLAGVPPLRVLRRELDGGDRRAWIGGLLALVAFTALLVWFAGDQRLAFYALGGFGAGALVFAVATGLVVSLVSRLRSLATFMRSAVMRLALASWARRREATITQTVALSIGLMAMMLLAVTRTDLIEGWRRASPPDAPNRFVINIQPDQRASVESMLREALGVPTPMYPMVRGRLIERNGVSTARSAGEPRERARFEREFNLSYMAEMPAHNRIVEGRWLRPDAAEVSVEEGLMRRLGLALGDRVVFDIAGERVAVTITGVRKLAWDSMKVNFFMILSPAALRDMPQTWITAFHQPADGADATDRKLVAAMPNLTVFDTTNIVRQVQTMLDQVVRAVQVLFAITLAAGMVVLYGALASSRDERTREAGLMRALGASRRQLASTQLWEIGLSGAMAGALAACGALATGALLADRVFQFELAVRWSLIPVGMMAGAALAILTGWLGLRPVFNTPPLSTLRDG